MKDGQEWIMRLTLDNETMTANVERVGDIIRCKDCKYCDVKNSADIYAVCKKHGHKFKPFGDDTRECFCSWAERKEE